MLFFAKKTKQATVKDLSSLAKLGIRQPAEQQNI